MAIWKQGEKVGLIHVSVKVLGGTGLVLVLAAAVRARRRDLAILRAPPLDAR